MGSPARSDDALRADTMRSEQETMQHVRKILGDRAELMEMPPWINVL
jgi:hypothetical protein